MPKFHRLIANSVYLPRGQVDRNQERLLRQINLVGLSEPILIAIVISKRLR